MANTQTGRRAHVALSHASSRAAPSGARHAAAAAVVPALPSVQPGVVEGQACNCVCLPPMRHRLLSQCSASRSLPHLPGARVRRAPATPHHPRRRGRLHALSHRSHTRCPAAEMPAAIATAAGERAQWLLGRTCCRPRSRLLRTPEGEVAVVAIRSRVAVPRLARAHAHALAKYRLASRRHHLTDAVWHCTSQRQSPQTWPCRNCDSFAATAAVQPGHRSARRPGLPPPCHSSQSSAATSRAQMSSSWCEVAAEQQAKHAVQRSALRFRGRTPRSTHGLVPPSRWRPRRRGSARATG